MADGKLAVVVGASRSGKSAWVWSRIKAVKRAIVWDIKGEFVPGARYGFADAVVCRTIPELMDAVKRAGRRKGRIVYHASRVADFDAWGRIAYAFGRTAAAVIVAEELADVTSPAKAPHGWGLCVRKALGEGCDIYAITQRPAESDKTALGNNSFIHCGRLARAKDRKYMADEMDCDVSTIAALRPLEWVERHADGAWKTGRVRV